jgi:hypothetical protein
MAAKTIEPPVKAETRPEHKPRLTEPVEKLDRDEKESEPPAAPLPQAAPPQFTPPPGAPPGTHFRGPLYSGNVDLGQQGTVVLAKRVDFTAANGNFSMKIALPPGATAIRKGTIITQTFAAGATAKLGTTVGGAELLTAALDVMIVSNSVLNGVGELATTYYITVAGVSGANGKASITLEYIAL